MTTTKPVSAFKLRPDSSTGQLVAALGTLFDECRFESRRLAPVAQLWVTWAVKHSHAMGKARVEAYRSPEVAARGAAQAACDSLRDTALPSRSARHDSRRASHA